MNFDYITKEAKNTDGMNNREKVSFHYFNKNGLYAEWKRNCERITKAVNDKIVKSGWHIAYGTFNDYHSNALEKLLEKRKVHTKTLRVCLKMFQENNEYVDSKLKEINY